MSKTDEYNFIYSGSEISVILLKGLLEEEGIPSIVQNGFASGNLGGFVGGSPTTVRLKVRPSDYERSRAIIKEFEKAQIKPQES